MKRLNKIFRGFIYVLPAVLFFSYYPIISLGSDSTMNFELSLPLIWLVLFDLIALVLLIRDKIIGEIFKWWAVLLFPIFASLSLVWSLNLIRGILTVGIMWLVYFACFAIYSLREILYDKKDHRALFLKVFFYSSLFICGWCLVQCILDVTGVTKDKTLMCPGCVSQMFGFPHPNGFAIEPQFMGNLLLAPALVAAWLYVKDKSDNTTRVRVARSRRHGARALILGRNLRTPLVVLFAFVFISTLFLTFSRGAIYSFIVAMMFMSGFLLVRKKKEFLKKIGIMWGVVILSFLFTLNLQGILSAVGPTNDTYGSAVTKVLNHLSLGIIDVRENTSDDESAQTSDGAPIYDGYVEESTSIRMELTKNAFKVWSKDFKTMMIGVGIGGAGQAMYDEGLIWSPKEIVQNEYASILLELGLVGVVLIIIIVVFVIKYIVKSPANLLLLSLMLAYGVSLLFFSGFANALQIYLLPMVFYIVFRKKLVS